jgi:hypothetical protein
VTNEEILALLRYQRTRFPADREALDRIEALLGSPSLQDSAPAAPALSLPLRVQPAKACSLGWSPELFALTLFISNVALRQEDGALVHRGRGPVVAVCAEYDRALISLEPPIVARHALSNSRSEGVPTLRVPGGFLRAPLRLESTSRLARAPAAREEAVKRAEQFLDQLDEAWQRRIGSVLEVAWPVYRPERSGPLLDAVAGATLPDLALR